MFDMLALDPLLSSADQRRLLAALPADVSTLSALAKRTNLCPNVRSSLLDALDFERVRIAFAQRDDLTQKEQQLIAFQKGQVHADAVVLMLAGGSPLTSKQYLTHLVIRALSAVTVVDVAAAIPVFEAIAKVGTPLVVSALRAARSPVVLDAILSTAHFLYDLNTVQDAIEDALKIVASTIMASDSMAQAIFRNCVNDVICGEWASDRLTHVATTALLTSQGKFDGNKPLPVQKAFDVSWDAKVAPCPRDVPAYEWVAQQHNVSRAVRVAFLWHQLLQPELPFIDTLKTLTALAECERGEPVISSRISTLLTLRLNEFPLPTPDDKGVVDALLWLGTQTTQPRALDFFFRTCKTIPLSKETQFLLLRSGLPSAMPFLSEYRYLDWAVAGDLVRRCQASVVGCSKNYHFGSSHRQTSRDAVEVLKTVAARSDLPDDIVELLTLKPNVPVFAALTHNNTVNPHTLQVAIDAMVGGESVSLGSDYQKLFLPSPATDRLVEEILQRQPPLQILLPCISQFRPLLDPKLVEQALLHALHTYRPLSLALVPGEMISVLHTGWWSKAVLRSICTILEDVALRKKSGSLTAAFYYVKTCAALSADTPLAVDSKPTRVASTLPPGFVQKTLASELINPAITLKQSFTVHALFISTFPQELAAWSHYAMTMLNKHGPLPGLVVAATSCQQPRPALQLSHSIKALEGAITKAAPAEVARLVTVASDPRCPPLVVAAISKVLYPVFAEFTPSALAQFESLVVNFPGSFNDLVVACRATHT